MEEKYGFIYITTNNINGKKYIGQKKYDKAKKWINYLGSGIVLNKSIKKYGRNNFTREIIEECETRELLNQKEKYWIEYYNATTSNDFYNIALGGDGGYTIEGYSDEQKNKLHEKLSLLRKGIVNQGVNNPNAKKVICLNTMEIFNTTVEAGKYAGVCGETIQSCCNHKKHSFSAGCHPATKERLMWEYYEDDKIYEYIPFKINTENITTKVMCINTNEVFNSIKEASEKYKVTPSNISSNCSHKSTFAGRDENENCLYWITYDEYINNGIDEKYYQRDKIQQFDINGNLINTFRTFDDAVKKTGFRYARIKRNIQGITQNVDGFVFKEQYQDIYSPRYKPNPISSLIV